jgi:catechol 2,3-dioxygenase-like lactoylglutathione lyase family enzyme
MLDHLSIQCSDVAASAAFYDAVLAPLGVERLRDFGEVVGYGVAPAVSFWIGPQMTGVGFRESHIGFRASSRSVVDEFFQIAAALGSEVLHAPALHPEYHTDYYGAFVRDPDGNNVEAVCRLAE